MTVEAGWYPYEGDPAGTVRRWNGHEWIGFPTTLPGTEQHQAASARAHAARRVPFVNQRRLMPFAALGATGLVATIATATVVLLSLLDSLQKMSDLGLRNVAVPMLREPTSHQSMTNFGVALVGGGVLFLVWLWVAHNNLGRNAIQHSSGSTPLWVWILFFNIVVWFKLSRFIFGPVVRRMVNLVEHSGAGPDAGKIGPFGTIAWWVLWIGSSYLFVLGMLHLAQGYAPGRGLLLFLIGLLGAHILSLLIALKLLIQITIFQDRRLAGA